MTPESVGVPLNFTWEASASLKPNLGPGINYGDLLEGLGMTKDKTGWQKVRRLRRGFQILDLRSPFKEENFTHFIHSKNQGPQDSTI